MAGFFFRDIFVSRESSVLEAVNCGNKKLHNGLLKHSGLRRGTDIINALPKEMAF